MNRFSDPVQLTPVLLESESLTKLQGKLEKKKHAQRMNKSRVLTIQTNNKKNPILSPPNTNPQDS